MVLSCQGLIQIASVDMGRDCPKRDQDAKDLNLYYKKIQFKESM